MTNTQPPLVTIRCLVFNHEPFLRQCLEGFVMQQTNFPFEAVIHDDASTDGSIAIIREYAEKYPHIIKPIFETENLYSKKDGSLTRIMNASTQGKYVAVCEGDDYWVSPHKLQKQVDFLEAHSDYSICFCRTRFVDTTGKFLHFSHSSTQEATYTLEDLKKQNIISNCSVMYRWRFAGAARPRYEDLPLQGIFPGDWMLHLLHAQLGKAYYDPEIMVHYRVHNDGVWHDFGRNDAFYIKNGYSMQRFFHTAKQLIGPGFEEARDSWLLDTIKACVATGNFELLSKLRADFPEAYESAISPLHIKPKAELTRKQAFAQRYSKLMEASPIAYRLSRWIYNLLRKKHKTCILP